MSQTKLVAFHNDPEIKEKYLARVEAHKKADEIEKGYYWEDGKGCAVGCTIEGSDHKRYETELGIPAEIAYLEDVIFEELPLARAKKWPTEFLTAITPGADLTKVIAKFIIWQWEDKRLGLKNLKDVAADSELVEVGNDLASLYQRIIDDETVATDEWDKLYRRADRLYWAWARAWASARARARAWAWAWARAWAWASARAWAWASASARAWASASARASEYSAGYNRNIVAMADKLLELLKEA